MLTGVYAARNILGEKYDVWSVNTEQEYHEESRVGGGMVGERLVPKSLEPVSALPSISPDVLIEVAFAKLDPTALGVAVSAVSGVGLFLATVVLLLQGGPMVGATLSLLAHYLFGYEVTWKGACIGLVEAGVGGFVLGYLGARLRNWSMTAYAFLLKRYAEAQARRTLLDKV